MNAVKKTPLFYNALKVASRHPTGRARGRLRNLYRVLTPAEVDLMAEAAAGGFNLGYESTLHRPNDKAGEVIASGVIALRWGTMR